MKITEDQKIKIWEDVINCLKADEQQDDEVTIKEYATMRGITENVARLQMEKLLAKGVVESRYISGKGGRKRVYRPTRSSTKSDSGLTA